VSARVLVIVLALAACSVVGCWPSWQYGRGSHGMTSASIGLLRDPGHPGIDTAQITDADRNAGEHVQVLGSLDDRPGSEVLAALDVAEAAPDQGRGLSDLRAMAARLGADAIADVEVTPPRPGETESHFCALAVRYQNVLADRPFDVIAQIEVRAPLIDQAYAELQQRAQAMHADYLRNVQYTPPDGTGQLRLRAEVIRMLPAAP
jgi:hypothetical protein